MTFLVATWKMDWKFKKFFGMFFESSRLISVFSILSGFINSVSADYPVFEPGYNFRNICDVVFPVREGYSCETNNYYTKGYPEYSGCNGWQGQQGSSRNCIQHCINNLIPVGCAGIEHAPCVWDGFAKKKLGKWPEKSQKAHFDPKSHPSYLKTT